MYLVFVLSSFLVTNSENMLVKIGMQYMKSTALSFQDARI